MKYIIAFASTLLFFLFIVAPVDASYRRSGEKIVVQENIPIIDDVYLAGQDVTVRGVIDGDLYCVGQTVLIEAQINGDLHCAGENFSLRGIVQGDVRVAGVAVKISGPIGASAMLLGQNLMVEQDANIGRNLSAYGETLNLRGSVGRDVLANVQNLVISNVVGRDVEASAESVELLQGATVNGNLNYISSKEAIVAGGVNIAGELRRQDAPVTPQVEKRANAGTWASSILFSFISTLLVIVVYVFCAPKFARRTSELMMTRWWSTFGSGLLVLVGGFLIPLFILFTIVGVKVSLLLWLWWIAVLILAPAVTGIAIGGWLKKHVLPDSVNRMRYYTLFGLFLYVFVIHLPYIGGLVGLIGLIWGLGGLYLSFWDSRKQIF